MEKWRGRIQKLTKKYTGGELGRYRATVIMIERQREKGKERKKGKEAPGCSKQASKATAKHKDEGRAK